MENYKYLSIVEWSKNYIAENRLSSGSRFLSENELCIIHGVSRQTVRQALMLLEQENVIVKVRGSGTFVKGSEAKSPAASAGAALITTYFSDYIFPSIITGIEEIFKKNGIAMQLAITHNLVSEELGALDDMLSRGTAGFIVEPSKSALPNPNMKLYDEIKKRGIPLVFINAKYPGSQFPCAAMDDTAAGMIAADCLFSAGHKNICGIFSFDDIQGHKRYQGFTGSCIKNGFRDFEKNVLWFSSNEKEKLFTDLSDSTKALLSSVTGVVCYNDKLAVELINFCRRQGISVPDDISVVGIDDSSLASLGDIDLTTVRHPHQQLGIKAAELLCEMINSPDKKYSDIIFTPQLVQRGSVRVLDKSAAAV